MKRVVSINGIEFDYPLFSSEELNADNYIGTKTLTIGGGYNIELREKGSLSKEVTFLSRNSAFIREKTRRKLMRDIDLNAKNVIFTDGSEETYYYNYTSHALMCEPLYKGSEWYRVELNLLKG